MHKLLAVWQARHQGRGTQPTFCGGARAARGAREGVNMGLDRGIKKNETLIKREKKRVKKERRQRKNKDLDSNVKG